MKIGLVCPYNVMRGGGVQECVFSLQRELSSRGHSVKIITPYPQQAGGTGRRNVIFIGDGRDIRSPFQTTAQVSVSVGNDAIVAMLEREQFDILHFHEPWVPIVSRQILVRSNAVNIGTFHAKLPETVMSRTIERVITPYTKSVLKYLHALTAVSEPAAEYVRTLTDEPVRIVPNGIDLSYYTFQPPTKPKKVRTLLYIGRLEKRKGVKYLLAAYKKLSEKHHDVRLVIAGDGPERAKLELYVQVHSIPRVVFTGYVTEAKKRRLLQQADVFCSPALYGESFGIVLLEAMAMGIVTLAGDNPGYATVLRDHGCISLVNPKSTTAFVHRMELLLYDEPQRDTWRRWALNYVKQFDSKQIADRYERVYATALNRRRKHT